jgi:hypothetical protein
MHGTTWAKGSALNTALITHRFCVSSAWIFLLLHVIEFKFQCSSLFLIVFRINNWMGQWNSEIVLISCGYSWTMILLGTVQSRSSASGEGRNTWQTWQGRGTWWEICTQLRSNMVGSGAQLIELVSFGLQRMKSLGCCSCSCSSGLVPCLPSKSFQPSRSPFIRICEFHGKLSFGDVAVSL